MAETEKDIPKQLEDVSTAEYISRVRAMDQSDDPKFVAEEKVRMAVFANWGNFARTKEHLQSIGMNFTDSQIRKFIKRFAGALDHDTRVKGTDRIISEFRLYTNVRIDFIREKLMSLKPLLFNTVSLCHGVFILKQEEVVKEKLPDSEVEVEKKTGKVIDICFECQKPCKSKQIPNEWAWTMEKAYLTLWREESEALGKFAEQMGLTYKPAPVENNDNRVVINQGNVMGGQVDPEMQKLVSQLRPSEVAHIGNQAMLLMLQDREAQKEMDAKKGLVEEASSGQQTSGQTASNTRPEGSV